jgi:PKHD-type hydroxylase
MRELFQVWQNGLSKDQISKILNIVNKKSLSEGSIFSSYQPMQSIRRSKICWISDEWIKMLLWEYVLKANKKSFQIDIENNSEIQFTEYRHSENGHYDWHHDVNWNGQQGADRKLSITIQLSDSNDYVGGDFEFDEIKTNVDFKSQGTIIVFPSYLRHRVLPVTSGVRKSLVAWFYGPKWR